MSQSSYYYLNSCHVYICSQSFGPIFSDLNIIKNWAPLHQYRQEKSFGCCSLSYSCVSLVLPVGVVDHCFFLLVLYNIEGKSSLAFRYCFQWLENRIPTRYCLESGNVEGRRSLGLWQSLGFFSVGSLSAYLSEYTRCYRYQVIFSLSCYYLIFSRYNLSAKGKENCFSTPFG